MRRRPLPHPPFNPGPAKSNADFLTREGAEGLASVIKAAWAKAGVPDLPVFVEPVRNAKGEVAHWAVRMPTLRRGLPVLSPA